MSRHITELRSLLHQPGKSSATHIESLLSFAETKVLNFTKVSVTLYNHYYNYINNHNRNTSTLSISNYCWMKTQLHRAMYICNSLNALLDTQVNKHRPLTTKRLLTNSYKCHQYQWNASYMNNCRYPNSKGTFLLNVVRAQISANDANKENVSR